MVVSVSRLPRAWVAYAVTLAAGFAIGVTVALSLAASPLRGMSSADKEWYLRALYVYCRGQAYGQTGEACMPLLRDGTVTTADLYAYRTAHP